MLEDWRFKIIKNKKPLVLFMEFFTSWIEITSLTPRIVSSSTFKSVLAQTYMTSLLQPPLLSSEVSDTCILLLLNGSRNYSTLVNKQMTGLGAPE